MEFEGFSSGWEEGAALWEGGVKASPRGCWGGLGEPGPEAAVKGSVCRIGVPQPSQKRASLGRDLPHFRQNIGITFLFCKVNM